MEVLRTSWESSQDKRRQSRVGLPILPHQKREKSKLHAAAPMHSNLPQLPTTTVLLRPQLFCMYFLRPTPSERARREQHLTRYPFPVKDDHLFPPLSQGNTSGILCVCLCKKGTLDDSQLSPLRSPCKTDFIYYMIYLFLLRPFGALE